MHTVGYTRVHIHSGVHMHTMGTYGHWGKYAHNGYIRTQWGKNASIGLHQAVITTQILRLKSHHDARAGSFQKQPQSFTAPLHSLDNSYYVELL